jgi:20S proteasome subunit beta 2
MSVFETQWKSKMTREDAVKLCADAIQAGIFNDLGSGSNVDVTVITEEKTTLMRGFITPNVRVPKQRNYKFAKGTTAVLNEKIITRADINKYVTVHELQDDSVTATVEAMDVDL